MYTYGMNLSEPERIAKNVRDLIELEKGTVPYDRERGVETGWRHKIKREYSAQMLTEITDMVNDRIDGASVAVSQADGELIVRINPND
jgi:hypothetical protein